MKNKCAGFAISKKVRCETLLVLFANLRTSKKSLSVTLFTVELEQKGVKPDVTQLEFFTFLHVADASIKHAVSECEHLVSVASGVLLFHVRKLVTSMVPVDHHSPLAHSFGKTSQQGLSFRLDRARHQLGCCHGKAMCCNHKERENEFRCCAAVCLCVSVRACVRHLCDVFMTRHSLVAAGGGCGGGGGGATVLWLCPAVWGLPHLCLWAQTGPRLQAERWCENSGV